MVKVMEKPHKIALQIAGFEDRDMSKTMHFPATRRELLDKLQVQVVVFHDRIEVKALFPIENIYCQECTSTYEGEKDEGLGVAKAMSLFITFEGGEGSGKSVQARALYRRLLKLAIPVILTHEPGGTPFGNKIGRWLKWAEGTDISPLTELLLFNASRAQLITRVIQPSLKGRKAVICDRYADSTTAYQSYGRGLDLEIVETTNKTATQGLKPDLTVLLDISAGEGLARKKAKKQDRFEREALAFHQRVREGYLKMAADDPERWLVVDGTQSEEKIEKIIWQRVSQMLSSKGG